MRAYAIAFLVQGGIGLVMALLGPSQTPGVLALLVLAAVAVAASGALLLRGHAAGFPLAVVMQALQVVQVSTADFQLRLEVGFGFVIGGTPFAMNIVAAGLLVGIITQRPEEAR